MLVTRGKKERKKKKTERPSSRDYKIYIVGTQRRNPELGNQLSFDEPGAVGGPNTDDSKLSRLDTRVFEFAKLDIHLPETVENDIGIESHVDRETYNPESPLKSMLSSKVLWDATPTVPEFAEPESKPSKLERPNGRYFSELERKRGQGILVRYQQCIDTF